MRLHQSKPKKNKILFPIAETVTVKAVRKRIFYTLFRFHRIQKAADTCGFRTVNSPNTDC